MVEYDPNFLDQETADFLFRDLWNKLDWERRPDAPRREYWVADRPYTYGTGRGQRTYEPRPDAGAIAFTRLTLKDWLGFEYNACFLNGYEGERDSLGWHADDDPGIDHTRPIAVVTVGAGREIQFKGPEGVTSQFLEPGSLLLMPAGFQQTHLHRIPKVGHRVGPRISLTFRSLLDG